jgi:excisionase family DNA binding protein
MEKIVLPASVRDLTDAPSPWWTVAQAAKYSQVGRQTIYKAIRAGAMKAAHVGGRREIRTRREWVDAFIEAAAQ